MRRLLLIIAVFLPRRLKPLYYRKLFGWKIAKSAQIGLTYLNLYRVNIGEYCRIGHFNMIIRLDNFTMSERSKIGNFNIIKCPLKGLHFDSENSRDPSLYLGACASITSRHFFDCSNEIRLGKYSVVAGRHTLFFGHSINIVENRQESAPITIGDYCMIGARSVITRGAVLPNYCLLASNSTLHKAHEKTYYLYSGVPAVPHKKLREDAKFFHREIGYVA